MICFFHRYDEQIGTNASKGMERSTGVDISQPGSGGYGHFLLHLHQNENKTIDHIHQFCDQRRKMTLLQDTDNLIYRCGKRHKIHAADSGKYLAQKAECLPQFFFGGINIEKTQVQAVFTDCSGGKSQRDGQYRNQREKSWNCQQGKITVIGYAALYDTQIVHAEKYQKRDQKMICRQQKNQRKNGKGHFKSRIQMAQSGLKSHLINGERIMAVAMLVFMLMIMIVIVFVFIGFHRSSKPFKTGKRLTFRRGSASPFLIRV